MKKTTADVPPFVASEYAKAPRAQAVSEAVGDGYTKTKIMQKARASKSKGQFGLPKTGKKPPMKMGR
jgi:hypothetical protein